MTSFQRPPLGSGQLVLLATLVGVISGVGAFAFYFLLDLCTDVFLSGLDSYTPPPAGGEVDVVSLNFHASLLPLYLIPAIGGLLSGLIVYTFAPEAEGHGTDAVIRAFHRMRGEIRSRVPIIKMIASSITIGSGGSAGREGPIIQIGAGFGSALASLLNLSDRDRRILLVCGMAGGIGSIFRSPFGGAIFGIEVLYKRDYEVEAIVPAFISSITAFIVFELIIGHIAGVHFGMLPIFSIPNFTFSSPLEMLLCVPLGLFAGVIGILYINTFYSIHNAFKKLNISPYLKPVIGGLVTGVIGFYVPQVLGMGYGYVQEALYGKLAIYVIIAAIFGKIVATSFTIGSGGSGGVFAPSIVIGSMVGAFFGYVFHDIIPVTAQPGSYVLIGMAAFVAGVAKTPIAAVLMVLEMSGGYNLLPALLLASTVAYYITGDRSIYAEQVATKLESPAHRGELSVDILQKIKVSEAMTPADKIITVSPSSTVMDVLELIEKTGHIGFPVVENGRLVGIVTFEDVEKVPIEERETTSVGEIMSRSVIVTYPDESLEEALVKLATYDIGRLPVVSREDEGKLLGLITRSAIIRAHARATRSVE
ncbi:chloride channel protein [Archaeoglobus veneficus]|uniref:Cl-channel voltage-gated family protein n=1 Tax=Archaeoglobus veneficus (strain DSM 11195 / SNP6) TaxID=693661 RepID=F2KPQ2_ARCVS|nr:chloride channel protein [Archaeoglobus veneficus]AEA47580.1 Cl- channel voltage-gated family protein [Archaeoglobus veneficus SNP6]